MGSEGQVAATEKKRQRTIVILFGLFIGLLVFCTLFSNTLESLTLPKVVTEKAALGSLDYKLEASGILRPVSEVKLANAAPWRVSKIYVKEGSYIQKGQTLLAAAGGYRSSDDKLSAIVTEEAKSYIAGQKSAEEVAKLIQNRVTTYLNE